MKTLLVYVSVHHQNTEKVVRAIAPVLQATLVRSDEFDVRMLSEHDLIGFASGIFFGSHHKTLLSVVDSLPHQQGKKSFILSTAGAPRKNDHRALRNKLMNKGFGIIGEFECKAWDTFGFLWLFGGINKGRPDENDLRLAREFAEGIKGRV